VARRPLLLVLAGVALVLLAVDRVADGGHPAATAEGPAAASTDGPVRRYAVVRVVDGDTVRIAYRGGTTVRLIGIDTPETVSPTVPDECGGQAATRAAHRMLDGARVALTLDPSQGERDRYGRTLGYLDVTGVGDYGETMIRRGHAAEYTYDAPYRWQKRYRAAEAVARSRDLAMWSTCGGPDVPLAGAPTR
jgi:micrococcal nuclease